MNTMKVIAGVVILAALGVGAWFVASPHQAAQNGPKVGSLAGPDIPSLWLKWGGLETWNTTASLAATSSIPVAIQNPAGATSTIEAIYCNINSNGLVAAQTFDISTSSTAFASSSPSLVLAGSIAAAGQKSIAWDHGVASSTNAKVIGFDSFLKTGESPYILGPTEYVTLRIATGTPGTFATYLGGSCSLQVKPLGR